MYTASNKSIFIDTSFFCAFYNDKDSQFKKSLSHIDILNTHNIYTSNFILLESYTVISQRVSKQIAVEFGETIKNVSKIKIIEIDNSLELDTWEIFKIVQNKNMSYVDCSTIAVMKENSIKQILTFDKHFQKLQKEFGYLVI